VTSLSAPPPAGPEDGVNHFTCYKVRRTPGFPVAAKITGVQVESVFEQGVPVAVDLVKPKRLCTPTNKNGEDPGAESDPDHLLCYKTRSIGSFGEFDVFLQNQFGPQTYRIRGSRRELCVPSQIVATS
jgi:hypothetical protein